MFLHEEIDHNFVKMKLNPTNVGLYFKNVSKKYVLSQKKP